VLGEPAREVDRGRVSPLEHAVLRGEEEVVERAAVDGIGESGHDVVVELWRMS
jgi:hypothetical protein